MAPKKRTTRTSAAAASGGRQTPLSFGASKITKPGAVQSAKELGKSSVAKKAVDEVAELSQSSARSTPLPEEKQVPVSDADADSARDESPLGAGEAATLPTVRASQAAKPAERLVTLKSTAGDAKGNADETRAKDISEARIKKYWKGKEDARIFPRGESFLPIFHGIGWLANAADEKSTKKTSRFTRRCLESLIFRRSMGYVLLAPLGLCA
jgi:hypothetical protein